MNLTNFSLLIRKVPSKIVSTIFFGSTLIAALNGCVNAVTVQIPHPVKYGLQPNRIPQSDIERSNYLGLPSNTFTSEASLISVDANQVCFGVTIRIDGDRAQLADLSQWRVFMRGDPRIEIMSPVFGPPAQQTAVQMQGSVPRQQLVGYTTQCHRYGNSVQCSQQPQYVTVRVPAIVNVLTGGGSVCFAHGGIVNLATEQLTLHLDNPNVVTHRMAFRWRFVR